MARAASGSGASLGSALLQAENRLGERGEGLSGTIRIRVCQDRLMRQHWLRQWREWWQWRRRALIEASAVYRA